MHVLFRQAHCMCMGDFIDCILSRIIHDTRAAIKFWNFRTNSKGCDGYGNQVVMLMACRLCIKWSLCKSSDLVSWSFLSHLYFLSFQFSNSLSFMRFLILILQNWFLFWLVSGILSLVWSVLFKCFSIFNSIWKLWMS